MAVAPAGAQGSGEGADLLSRVLQVICALVLAVVSVLLMITLHRFTVVTGGVTIPLGLIMGGLFQLAASVFLLSATGRRMPLVVLAGAWAALAMVFAGSSAGGGVLMPGQIGGAVQYQGWIVQALGVGIPLVVLAAAWVARMRALLRASERSGPGVSA